MVPFPDFLKWTIIVLIPSVIIHFLIFLYSPMGDELCVGTFIIIVVAMALTIYYVLWYRERKRQEDEAGDEVDRLLKER